ncbi:MAG: FIST C-terminal domain-containing protein [Candidatus Omnitrophica bacterium]|nr:FIST C-terminal domain-containing protein [Candidatus Omnitrophota bacterium]
MPIRTGIGVSRLPESYQAGREAARIALSQSSSEDSTLLLVFSSARYSPEALLRGIRTITRSGILVGCTTAGEITSQGPSHKSVVVVAITNPDMAYGVGLGQNISHNARAAGYEAGREAKLMLDQRFKGSHPLRRHFLLMLSEGLKGNCAETVRGLQNVMGNSFPIVGGSAGDDLHFVQTHQFLEDKVLSDSVVCLLVAGNISVGIGARHGWKPLGKPKTVTQSSSNTIEKIDDRPAVSVYDDYFGDKARELRSQSLTRMALLYPLGLSVPDETEYLVRNAMRVQANGAVVCGAEVPQGSEVRLMMGTKTSAITAARQAAQEAKKNLGKASPKLALIFESASRHQLLGRRAEEELEIVQKVIGAGVPLAGFYTYGEQAPLKAIRHMGQTHFHNESIVVVLLGE